MLILGVVIPVGIIVGVKIHDIILFEGLGVFAARDGSGDPELFNGIVRHLRDLGVSIASTALQRMQGALITNLAQGPDGF